MDKWFKYISENVKNLKDGESLTDSLSKYFNDRITLDELNIEVGRFGLLTSYKFNKEEFINKILS